MCRPRLAGSADRSVAPRQATTTRRASPIDNGMPNILLLADRRSKGPSLSTTSEMFPGPTVAKIVSSLGPQPERSLRPRRCIVRCEGPRSPPGRRRCWEPEERLSVRLVDKVGEERGLTESRFVLLSAREGHLHAGSEVALESKRGEAHQLVPSGDKVRRAFVVLSQGPEENRLAHRHPGCAYVVKSSAPDRGCSS